MPKSVKVSRESTVGKREAISQAELAEVLAQNESLNRRIIEIRERINRGAEVEPGELFAEAERDNDDDGSTSGLSVAGLDIEPTADLIARNAEIEENRKRVAAMPVFCGDLASARSRFQDVSSVFLRTATAEDLNRVSFQLSGGLGVDYGLTDLHEQIRAEIDDDRRAVENRRQLRICPKPAKAARNVHV